MRQMKTPKAVTDADNAPRKTLKLSGKMVVIQLDEKGEAISAERESETPELKYTGKEKQAAAILDQLLSSDFIEKTGAFISPETYSGLVIQLRELL